MHHLVLFKISNGCLLNGSSQLSQVGHGHSHSQKQDTEKNIWLVCGGAKVQLQQELRASGPQGYAIQPDGLVAASTSGESVKGLWGNSSGGPVA